MFSTFVAKKQHLLLKFGRILVFSDNFQENDYKNFFSFFFHFFFVHRLVWNLSFQTHSDSSKNIKNSLFYAILKNFCHFWLGSKEAHFGQYLTFLDLKRLEKQHLRRHFAVVKTNQFCFKLAQNFKRDS